MTSGKAIEFVTKEVEWLTAPGDVVPSAVRVTLTDSMGRVVRSHHPTEPDLATAEALRLLNEPQRLFPS